MVKSVVAVLKKKHSSMAKNKRQKRDAAYIAVSCGLKKTQQKEIWTLIRDLLSFELNKFRYLGYLII